MSRGEALYLRDIVKAIEAIRRFTAGGRESFFADDMIQSAVVRQLEIIGEAVKHLGQALLASEPDVPWPKIARTRDLLAHGYFQVDLDIVWGVVEGELSKVDAAILRMLQQI